MQDAECRMQSAGCSVQSLWCGVESLLVYRVQIAESPWCTGQSAESVMQTAECRDNLQNMENIMEIRKMYLPTFFSMFDSLP